MWPMGTPAKQVPPPLKYNVEDLKKDFDGFITELDFLKVAQDYPKAIRKLFSGDSESQIEAVRTLAETGEIEVIPWLLPFLDTEDKNLRIWTGASLEKLVSSHVLKRRDMSRPDVVLIRPLRPGIRIYGPLRGLS
jgi:hypothetical protein